ncbi:MAG TPA: carboxypeptidase regulatory-like domain-containing protein, partial [Thermoanaerobaculia bacterium]|nr:carboxypeptidase regulatory-like domain-containing protein [Thermoanaerobaculia bacterium]
GGPLPGAAVGAAMAAGPGQPGRVLARTVSGAAGRFVLTGLSPGTALEITASHPGHLAASLRTTAPAVGSAAAPLRLVLPPGRAAVGRVLDTAERPVAAAEVAAWPSVPAAARGPMAPIVRAVSDEAGRFEISGLPATRVDLEARAPGFAPLVVRGVEVPSDGAQPVDLGTLVLEPGAVLAGRVTGRGGAPLPGAEVRMMLGDDRPPAVVAAALAAEPPRAVTDRAGRFRLPDLPSGRRVHLLVTAAGHLPVELPGVPVPPSVPVEVELEAAARLAGRLEEADGQPVAGGAVLLRSAHPPRGTSGAWQPRPVAEAVSDGEGHFRFEDVAAGSAVLEVTAPGYVRPEPVPVEIAAGPHDEEPSELVVVLTPGARVEGTVRDEGGEPVAEVPVRVGRVRDTTDAEGRFRLDGVEPGRRMLVAAHLEYDRLVREVEVEPAGSRFDLVLTGGWPVSGRVVDQDGAPVPGAEVRLTGDPAGGEMRLYRATSDGEGEFRFPRVVDGRYALTAAAAGFAAERRTEGPRVSGAPVEELEIVLAPGTEVEGRLLGLEFDAVATAAVSAEGEGGERIGTVNHEGRFRVTDLGPGVWRLRARAPGGRQAEARLVVEPGVRRLHRDLRFEGFALAGQVTHGGEPVAGASVSALGRDTGTERSEATDWEGRFVLENLPPGHYLLSVASPRDGLLDNRELDLAADREIAVDIAARRFAGRVVSSAGGRPVRDALVRLQRELGARGEAGSLITVATDTRGGFEVQRVSDGSYLLAVEADGYVPHERRLEIAAGGEAVEVVLEPADILEVVLGGAAAGARVVRLAVLGASGTVVSQGAYPVEDDGRVRLRRLPAGAWRLLISTPASAVTVVAARAPGPPVEVAPPSAAHLDVRVPALLDTNTSGELTLAAPDGSSMLGQDPSGAPRDRWPLPGGAGVVDNLPPGTWMLRVTAPDGRIWEQPVTLSPGDRQVVTLP